MTINYIDLIDWNDELVTEEIIVSENGTEITVEWF